MEALVASAVGIMTAAGIFLILRRRTFPVILGLSLITYAVNVFLFATGRLALNAPAVLNKYEGRALYRSAAAGAGADGHRDFLRDDGGDRDDRAFRLSVLER